jgi:hypothetical protein
MYRLVCTGSLLLAFGLLSACSETVPQPQKSEGKQGKEDKEKPQFTVHILDGKAKVAAADKKEVVASFTIEKSQVVKTDGAVKVKRQGGKIEVVVSNLPFLEGKAVANDGCWVVVENGEVTGCRNDGDCSKNCLLRTYNGYAYCVCGDQ